MLDIASLKASIVLQAMVAGLLKSKDDPNFTFEIGTYGYVKEQLCYGCGATLALAELFGNGQLASELMLAYAKTPTDRSGFAYAYLSDVIRSEPSSVQDSLPIDLRNLEVVVEDARAGVVSWLIGFFTGRYEMSFDGRWCLDDRSWEEQIPVVEATIAEMAAAGY